MQPFRSLRPLQAAFQALGIIFTRMLRLAFPLRCLIAKYFYPVHNTPYSRRILRRLDPFTFAKRSRRHAVMREADALTFVSRWTTIPVPRVYDVFIDKSDADYGWLLMEYIPGVTLNTAWSRMNASQRQSVMLQLGDILRQLRSLPHPFPSRICSCTGGPIHDDRFAFDTVYGPFDSEEDFNIFMYNLASRNYSGESAGRIPKQLNGHDIVFTHADFHPKQILLDSSDLSRVVAVLDWEMASWYPAYWEPMKSDDDSRLLYEMGWKAFVESVTGRFHEEEDLNWALVAYQGEI